MNHQRFKAQSERLFGLCAEEDVRKGSAFPQSPFLIGTASLHDDERDGKAKPFRTSGGEAAKAEMGNYGVRFHFNTGVASVKS